MLPIGWYAIDNYDKIKKMENGTPIPPPESCNTMQPCNKFH